MKSLPDLYAPRPDTVERVLPIMIGVGLVGIGTALWKYQPRFLDLPDSLPIEDDHAPSRFISAATDARDGIARIMPSNLATSLSRSLIITGMAMVLVRALDELTGRHR